MKTISEFDKKHFGIATCEICPMSDKAIDKLLHKVANLYIRGVRPLMPHIPGFCIFVRKSVHNRIGGFDERIKLAEDHDYANALKR